MTSKSHDKYGGNCPERLLWSALLHGTQMCYNIEVTSELSTKCELNNSTHIEYPDDLKPWSKYNYRGANVR